MTIDTANLGELYERMLRIRRIEERIEALYHLDEMKTPVHLCIGQEAIPVGVCAHLTTADFVSSNHRSHGHYLAKGGNLRAMIAELYCRETGCSKGRGGSMHLIDVNAGVAGSSAIVGGGIPIATGLGLSFVMQGKPCVSVVFFGDGAADEGVLYESVNFAVLKKLPVIYVLENNQYSVCSPVQTRQAISNPYHGIASELLESHKIDGNDIIAVWQTAQRAVQRARNNEGPSFIECVTYRWRGHAGAGSDAHLGYRTQEEIAAWEQRCPIVRCMAELRNRTQFTDKMQGAIEERIKDEIDDAFKFAVESMPALGENVHKYLFAE